VVTGDRWQVAVIMEIVDQGTRILSRSFAVKDKAGIGESDKQVVAQGQVPKRSCSLCASQHQPNSDDAVAKRSRKPHLSFSDLQVLLLLVLERYRVSTVAPPDRAAPS
jgi:hypothetical protein